MLRALVGSQEIALKIYTGSDHAGVSLRQRLVDELRRRGHEMVDLGPETTAPSDYPDYALDVGRAVRDDRGSRGVLVCGSATGICIAANKVRGIRAAAPCTAEAARLSRTHNDSNVLCLGARLLPEGDVMPIVDAWLGAAFEGGRHATRVGKIAGIEESEGQGYLYQAEWARLQRRDVVARIWRHEPDVFTADPTRADSIKNRLGWLRAPAAMAAGLSDIEAFVEDIRRQGFHHVVLLGMGGSSLCPEVLLDTFGAAPGWPRLLVLDNTDPEAVAAVDAAIDPERTLFVVASKSGTTIEVKSFESHFWAAALGRHGGRVDRAGAQFVAITDPGTELERRARENQYRKCFINPPDIGGRYSALSLFGLVPAGLLGIDVQALLAAGQRMATACETPEVTSNPGARLGGQLAALAKQGRDKLTLVMSPEIASLGSWIEQLLAESTGKEGKGIVPVDLEPLGPPEVYGDDRVFVLVDLEDGAPSASPEQIAALRGAGHPVLDLALPDRHDLGAELFRWEMATAVAGASLGLNPFDEPNVTEAKQATADLLAAHARDGKLPVRAATTPDDRAALETLLGSLRPGDYLALNAFFMRTSARDRLLTEIRTSCRDGRRVATTVGYGPRFLHSTGQLHKGGPNTGVFIQLTADPGQGPDLPVPNQRFTFGVLRTAQALGDFEVLQRHHRRALRVHLGSDLEGGLRRLGALLSGGRQTP